jgi:hypothetical protein
MAAAKMPSAASVFGLGGAEPPESEAETDVPEDFEAYAIEAFPDLESDPARIAALKHAIEACVRAKNAGKYSEK